eukprot:3876794-Rhodomonas_salina.5
MGGRTCTRCGSWMRAGRTYMRIQDRAGQARRERRCRPRRKARCRSPAFLCRREGSEGWAPRLSTRIGTPCRGRPARCSHRLRRAPRAWRDSAQRQSHRSRDIRQKSRSAARSPQRQSCPGLLVLGPRSGRSGPPRRASRCPA